MTKQPFNYTGTILCMLLPLFGCMSYLSKKESATSTVVYSRSIAPFLVYDQKSQKVKDIQEIYFDLEKDLGSSDLILKNVKINSSGNFTNSDDIFVVKNIQNLRSFIRKVID